MASGGSGRRGGSGGPNPVEYPRSYGVERDGTPRFRMAMGIPWDRTARTVCWWDCGPLESDGDPFPYPLRFDELADVWYVAKHERFCSPNCCRAYNKDRRHGDWQYRDGLIVKLARVCSATGYRMGEHHVMCAPPRYTLEFFAGPGRGLSWCDFRRGLECPCTIVELPHPMIAAAPTIAVQRPRYTPKPISIERIMLARRRKADREAVARHRAGGTRTALEIAMGITFGGAPPPPPSPPSLPKKEEEEEHEEEEEGAREDGGGDGEGILPPLPALAPPSPFIAGTPPPKRKRRKEPKEPKEPKERKKRHKKEGKERKRGKEGKRRKPKEGGGGGGGGGGGVGEEAKEGSG